MFVTTKRYEKEFSELVDGVIELSNIIKKVAEGASNSHNELLGLIEQLNKRIDECQKS